MSMPKPPGSKKCDHALIGKEVWYRGEIWRVVSAHAMRGVNPWLTLKRGMGIEVLAKSYELKEAYN